jgi:hypothetical protein
MHYFGVPKLRSMHSTPLEPKLCLGVFQSISLTFGTQKMQNMCFGVECTISGTKVVKHPFYSIGPKLMFGCVTGYFANLWHVKDEKLVFEPECTISGYQTCEPFILLDWNQNNFWECFGAFR